jgi:large subunit ribosomal protein L4
MIAAALRGALSDRAREGRIHVVSAIVAGETPSTKAALQALSGIGGAKLLVVLGRDEDVAWLSLRNVPSVHALAVDQLNAYDVLVSDDVLFTTAALAAFTGLGFTETEEAAK